MDLAFECPTSLLEQVQPLADFDWILAHKVLDDQGYAEYYRNSRRLKVLDNSCCELRYPLALSDLAHASDLVSADLVVSPDFLGQSDSTIEELDRALKVFGSKRLFPVAQGRNLSDVVKCASLIQERGFTRIAIPVLRGDPLGIMAGRRSEIVEEISRRCAFNWIHLLGMTTLGEFGSYRQLPAVKSLDTGGPVRYGMKSVFFGLQDLEDKTTPTFNLMEEESTANLAAIYYNIAYLRKVLQKE